MEILLILFLILLNGFFSMAETALISSRKSKLKYLADSGHKNAQQAFLLAEKPSIFLSTVQVGITLIAILTGAVGEGSLGIKLSKILESYPLTQNVNELLSFIIVITLITFFSIVIGELLPKRIALSNPEKIASLTAPIMNMIAHIFNPIVHLLTISTEFIFKLSGLKSPLHPAITEDEIRVMIREGTEMGIFNKTEKKLVERALRLDDLRVIELMTPRTNILYFDLKKFSEDPLKYIVHYHHTRILFTKGTIDKVVGVIHVKDLLHHYLEKNDMNIEKKLNKPLFIPENTRALKVLEMFRHSPIHIALIVDEYGHVKGLVTLNDILEALVGEIKSQSAYDPQIVKRDNGSLLVDGMVTIDKMKKHLEGEKLTMGELETYQTVGGFIMSNLDRIPKSGDVLTWHGYKFEVVDMDDKRVDKVIISKNKNE